MSSWTAASSDCSRPVNNYVHVKTADLYRPNARLTPERQGYQVLTPFGKLGYSHISNQLFQVKLDREEAEQRVRSLQAALRAYMGQEVAAAVETAGSEGAPLGLAPGSQAIVPQFGDSALELLMDMSVMNNDADYRQRLTDQVITEGLVVAGLEREQANYEEASVSRPIRAALVQQAGVDRIHSEIDEAFVAVVRVVGDVNTIYEELSAKNLTPATLLYSLSSPFSQSTERSVTVRDLALYGLLVLVLSLIIVPVGCLGHSYFQREIVHQETDEQRVGKARGGQAKGLSEEELPKRNASA